MTKFSGYSREQNLNVFGADLCIIVDIVGQL